MPPKSAHPNFKLDEFFKHFNEVPLEMCKSGEFLSADEQDQRSIGKGGGIVKCKFKKEGDEHFIGSLCEREHVLTFYPRN